MGETTEICANREREARKPGEVAAPACLAKGDARSLFVVRDHSQLAQHPVGIHFAPSLDDPSVNHTEDIDSSVTYLLARRLEAHSLSLMCTANGEADGDFIFGSEDVLDSGLHIRKRGKKIRQELPQIITIQSSP